MADAESAMAKAEEEAENAMESKLNVFLWKNCYFRLFPRIFFKPHASKETPEQEEHTWKEPSEKGTSPKKKPASKGVFDFACVPVKNWCNGLLHASVEFYGIHFSHKLWHFSECIHFSNISCLRVFISESFHFLEFSFLRVSISEWCFWKNKPWPSKFNQTLKFMFKKLGQTLKTSFKVWSNFEINVSIFYQTLKGSFKVWSNFDWAFKLLSNFGMRFKLLLKFKNNLQSLMKLCNIAFKGW